LEPIRERRAYYEQQCGLIEEIVAEGTRKASQEANETLRLVKEAMGFTYSQSFEF
jgi:tryptophanyl-tRNA synthetase